MAEEYISRKDRAREVDTTIKMLDMLSSLTSSISDQEKISDYKNKLQHNSLSPFETKKLMVRAQWIHYRDPTMTVTEAVSRLQMAKTQQMHELLLLERNGCSDIRPKRFPEKAFVQTGEIFYAVNPQTGKVEDEPLENPNKFHIRDLPEIVERTPYSNSIHTLRSIEQLLMFGEKHGLNRETLATLMVEFVDLYVPQYKGRFYYLSDPTAIFEALLGTVSFASLQNNIRKAIANLYRIKTDNVSIVLNSYKTLLFEMSSLDCPLTDEQVITEKVDEKVLEIASSFVVPSLAVEVEKFRTKVRNRYQRNVTLDEVIEFISTMESELEAQYKPKHDVYHNKGPIPVSIYNCDTVLAFKVTTQFSSRPSTPSLSRSSSRSNLYAPSAPPPTSPNYQYTGYGTGNWSNPYVSSNQTPNSPHSLRKSRYPSEPEATPMEQKEHESQKRPRRRVPSKTRKNCYMCSSLQHSRPLPRDAIPKNEDEYCPYQHYPRMKHLCDWCHLGFHSKDVCMKKHENVVHG